ncbi:MAG: DVU_1556 family methyltransferase, partial [Otoolea sp.]
MERRTDAEKECMLCRPGGFSMTEELFSLADLDKRVETLTVVDVGCGSGAAMWYLKQKHPSWDICGVDPYPEMEEAKTFSGTCPVRLAGRAEKLPFPDASVDVILMECSFSKTEDPDGALAEILRVLKPDGWFLLSDMYARKKEIAGAESGRQLLGRLESHKTIWNRLRNAGFSVLEMKDKSEALIQWIGQRIMDGEGCALYENLGVDRETLKQAGCGYFVCAARPSGLWRTLEYAVENSPFYRKKCGKLKFLPGDWAIFRSLPFTTPEDIRENPEDFVCVNPKEIAR